MLTGLFIHLLAAGNMAFGALRTASVSGNWDDVATWGGQPVPTSADDIIIAAGVTVTMNVNGSCLTISDMSGDLVAGGGMLTIAGNGTTAIQDITGTALVSCPVDMPATATITVTGNLTFGGDLGGASVSLIKKGSGTLIFASSNSYTGSTLISHGAVNVQNSAAFGGPMGGSVVVQSGATLELEGAMLMLFNPLSISGEGNLAGNGALNNVSGSNMWAGPITIDAPVTSINSAGGGLLINSIDLQANELILKGAAPDAMVGGTISSSLPGGSILKTDAGAWTLSGNNTFSGGVTLSEGTLNINNPHALGNMGSVFTIGGAGNPVTIDNTSGTPVTLLDYPQVWKDDFTFTGTSDLNLGNGNISMSTNVVITVASGVLTAGGTINQASYDITKQGIGQLVFDNQDITLHSLHIDNGKLISSTASLNLTGDFINNGIFDAHGGTVSFNGSVSQNIGGSQPSTFNNLVLANAAGAVLGNSQAVNGVLTLSTGNLLLGSNNLTLGLAAVAGGPSSTNMIVADGTGECRRVFTSDGSYLFPVGDATGVTEYSPVLLNFTSGSYASAWVGVRVTDAQHPDDAGSTDFLSRYWSISQSGISSASYDVTAWFVPADVNGSVSNIVSAEWPGSAPWKTFGPATPTEISASGVTDFGDFTGIAAAATPPKINITASPSPHVCVGTAVTLTANATGTPGFTYLWAPNGETTQSVNAATSTAGSVLYSVTVTDGNGLSATDTITVAVGEVASVTATPDHAETCSGTAPAISLSGSNAGTTFSWSVVESGVSGATAASGNTIAQVLTLTGGTDGTATYTIIPSNNGCDGSPVTVVITVHPDNTITLASAVGTDNQAVCSNTAISNIVYSTTGATGATFSGLPAGVAGTFASNTITISGSSATAGVYPYIVTLTGGCGAITTSGTLTVSPANSIVLTSAPGTDNQSKCVNTPITDITYATTGASGATFSGLPAGVSGSWAANTVTLSGTPNVNGVFNYTITLTGGCGNVTGTGTIHVPTINTIALTSGVGTDNQTICANTPITPITYSTSNATGATFSGLPAGVSGNWASNVVTISGTPSASGNFAYFITLTGGCGSVVMPGNIRVNPSNTIALSSAAGTDMQGKCINTPITAITYTTTGATGATFTGLPAGVSGNWAGNIVTISGMPSVAGTFPFTVKLTGGCGNISKSGTLTIFDNNTLVLSSAAGTDNQLTCINTPIVKINYASTGATGATFTGLPAGVSGSWAANVVTINGTPTAAGTYNYTVNLTGGCSLVSKSGTLVVNPNNTIVLSSAVGTDCQVKCINTPITDIVYTTTGATGATFTNLPAGVSGAVSGNVITISGTPTVSGVFNFSVTLTGGCGSVNKTGTLTIHPNNAVTLSSAAGTDNQVNCVNTAITLISYNTTIATGASITGLPAGVSGSWSGNVVSISGNPTSPGNYPYTVTTTGGCGIASRAGTISVTPVNSIALSSAPGTDNQTVCINTSITAVTYTTTGASGATFTGLPAGVAGSWAGNVVTLSGSPTVSGTYTYTVTLTGGCGSVSKPGIINVTPANTIVLTSGPGTDNQSKCINAPISAITYTTTGASGATITGLPAGVTGSWAGNTITIGGTPTASGNFVYTITLTGGCGAVTKTGTLHIASNNTIALSSAPGTDNQTQCINSAITAITYATSGANGANFSGLPAGTVGSWASNVITITGSPISAGLYNYTVSLTGGCNTGSANGAITVSPNNSIVLSSAAGTDNQVKCINTPITPITYSTTGALGASFVGLPAGVSGSWAGNVVTISGTPTVSGHYNYQINLTGGCGAIITSGSIWVTAANTLALTSAMGTDNQTKCINTPITNVTYTSTGATGAVISGLPAGLSGSWASNVVTISGTPTTIGTSSYTVTLTGGCALVSKTGNFTVTPDNTIVLSSASGTDNQSCCVNTPIVPVSYTTTGATGAIYGGLPAGVNGTFSGNTVTINGTPTASGNYNYTVTLVGGCGSVSKTGSISVLPINTISLTSAPGTDNQTQCINTAINNITYVTTGATGATVTGLPAGISGNWAGNVVTISGTSSVSGTFLYTITLTGGCGAVSKTGTLKISPENTIVLSSAAGTDNQVQCVNTAISNITYTFTGASGATFSNLPVGVSGSIIGNNISIGGSPSVSGVRNYVVTLTGGCGNVSKTGTLTITPQNTIALTSAPGTDAQAICLGSAIIPTTFATTGATGATFSGLPTGVSGSWAGNVVTINGTPVSAGSYAYTVSLSGGCGVITKIATIVVSPNNTIVLSSAPGTDNKTACLNAPITNITYTTTGATGATFSGLPAGVSGNWVANSITISGSPTVTGNFPYTITLTGGCGIVSKTGNIQVKPVPVMSASPSSQTICSGLTSGIGFSSTVAGTSYAWSVVQANVSGASAGSGSNLAMILTATAAVPGTATFTVTPTASSCAGSPVDVVITVKPSPTAIPTPSAQTICSGTAPSISLSSAVAGATFTWTAGQAGVSGASAGSGSTISQTLSATGLVSGTATYSVKGSANGCTSSAVNAVVTVKPLPVVSASPSAQSICSGSNTAINLSSSIGSTTFSWTAAVSPAASVIGFSGGNGNQISQNLINNTLLPGVVTYTVTPTAGTCVGLPLNVPETVNPIATLTSPLSSTVCSQSLFTYTPTSNIGSSSFAWSRTAVLGIQNASAAGVGNISETLVNTTGTAKVVTYVITLTTNGCSSTQQVNVIVNPSPVLLSTTTPLAVCSDAAFNYTPVSSVSSTSYAWTRAVVAGISNPAGSGSGNISEILSNNTPNDIAVPYVLTMTAGSCATNATVTATIKPKPELSGTLSPPGVCSGSVFSYTPASIVPSTSFSWSRSPVFGISNGPAFGTDNPNEILLNTITSSVDVTYTFTSQANGCSFSQDVVVTVKPAPVVNIPTDKEFCSGVNTPVISLTGPVAGSVFTWTNDHPSIGLSASGTGDIPSFLTTNTTSLPILSNIAITPSANGCTGTPASFILAVNPTASANVPPNQALCNGSVSNAVIFTGVLSSISWTNDHPEIGLAPSGTGNIATFTAVNAGTSPIVASITAVPHYSVSGSGCSGAPIVFTITVYPTPNVTSLSNEVLCADAVHPAIVFSTASTGGTPVFNWSSNLNIGFGLSGTGNIPVFTPTNAGSGPVTATLSVSTTLNGCSGVVSNFSFTVNPTPDVLQPANQTICNNTISSAVNFSGTATSFSWSNSNPSVGLPVTGTGDIPSFVALNGGSSNITGIVSVTPFYTNGGKTCAGTNKLFTFTVKPTPSAAIAGSTTVCQNAASPLITFTGSAGVAPYTFIYQVNGGASQTITTISGNSITLGVPTATVGTYQYKVLNVSSAGGCAQTQSATATVVVVALPTATVSGTATVCQNSASPSITFTGANGIAPYVFTYKLNGGADQTITTAAGNSVTLAVPTNASGTFVYSLVSVGSASGCSLVQAGSVTITVNASPNLVINNPAAVCSPATIDLTSAAITAGSTAGLNYSYWTNPGATISYITPAIAGTGTYYIKGVDLTSGCSSVKPVVVTVNTTPTLVVNNPAPVCAPATLNLTLPAVTAGSTPGITLTYWIDSVASIPYPTPTTADDNTFYIKGTAASGCAVIKPVVASVYATLGIPVFALGPTSNNCKGGAPVTFTASVTNAFALTYTLDAASLAAGNTINSTTGQVTFVPTWTGTSQITAKATGCGAPSTAIHTVVTNPSPSVSLVVSPSTAICEGSSVTLTATSSGGTVMKTTSGTTGNVNLSIPDNSKTTYANSTIDLTGSGGATLAATDMVMVTVNITHNNDQDLDFFLIDPSNTRAMLLSSGNGGGGNNYTNTVFRPDAATSITAGTAAFTGSYKPEGSITTAPDRSCPTGGNYNLVIPANALVGASVDGTWTLRVFDNKSGITGKLVNWSLSIIQPIGVGYTTVVNGPPAIGAVSYSGASNSIATAVVTPPAGTQTYTVTTSDSYGCPATSNVVNIVVKPAPIPVVTADYCTFRPKVRLTTPSCSSCTYQWNTGATTNIIDVDIAGKYTVAVTYANGCIATNSIQVADELVVNGDFSAGNTGFTTGYGYKPDVAGNTELQPEGYYGVGTNGQNYHVNFWGKDHTTGTGNFMIVNGWGSAYTVWEEDNVAVTPNTDYYFAAWAISLNNVGPFAKLRFEVNGVQVGSTANLTAGTSSNANAWKPQDRFYGVWNSGASTTANIRIINLEPSLGGNDFGLDDISFGTLVNIPFTVAAASNSPAVTPICSRNTLQLTSTVSGGKPPIVYSWTGPNGFTSNQANPSIANIPANGGGTYSLSVTDWYNCPATAATTVVVLNTTPEIADRAYTICSNSAFTATPVNGVPTAATIVPAGTTFSWGAPSILPAGSITGASAQAGQTAISQTLINTTTAVATAIYTVTPSTGSCTGPTFKVTVTVNPGVSANAGANTQICAGSTVVLNGSIGGAATSGNWTGGTGTFAPSRNALNAVYTPSAAEVTAGTVTLTLNSNDPDGAGPCSAAVSTIVITINPLPVLTSTSVNLNCKGASTGSIDLTVAGGTPSFTYNWSAGGGGLVPVGQSNNQDLTGLVAGVYSVNVNDSKMCTASASITITEPPLLVASESHTTVPCALGATWVTITASGGTPPYASGTGIFAQPAGTTSYTVVDSKGCSSSILATVIADPNTAPVISVIPVTRNLNGCSTASISGPAFSAISAVSSYPEFSNATNKGVASDNCAITTVTYKDVVTSASCPVVVTRTWSLGDASGLISTCNQVITIQDVDPPVWTTAAGSLNRSVDCSDGAALAAAMALFPVATDACDSDVTNIVKFSQLYVASPLCAQSGTYTNTWTVSDDCGNTSTVFTQTITVTDNTAPAWITPAGSLDRTVECSNVAALAAAQLLKPVASDLCDGNVSNIVKVSGAFVPGGSCPNQGSYINTWTVKDDCGNVSSVFTQHINIVDNTAPQWLTAPMALNRTVGCSDVAGLATAEALYPIAWDNCDANVTNIIKTAGAFVPVPGCPIEGSYTNTWKVTDDCGNVSAVYTQVITVQNMTDPSIICPVSNAYDCDAPSLQPAFTGVAIATGDCGGSPTVTWSDVTIPGACAGNYRINRNWIATNVCGKTASCVQTLFIQDATPPAITCGVSGNQDIHMASTAGYIHSGNSWDAAATDNCSGVTLSVSLSGATSSAALTTLNGVTFNEGVTTVTWKALDGCGTSAVYIFTVTVAIEPVISCPAAIIHSNDAGVCNATLNPGFPVTAQGTLPISYSWVMTGTTTDAGTGPVGNYAFNLGTTTITWTATNTAGSDVCSQTITINDNQAPVFNVPADKVYCVKNIVTADYFDPTTDIVPDRPEYFTFPAGDTDLDLDLSSISDNCPLSCSYQVKWRIDFQDGTSLPAAPGTYLTGQPSAYGLDILLPGNSGSSKVHQITYVVVDCNGNASAPATVKITINPRPDIIKLN